MKGELKMSKCPRCSGQMGLEQDMHGKYLNCFQCGNNVDLEIFRDDAPQMVSITGRQATEAILSINGPNKYIHSFTMGQKMES